MKKLLFSTYSVFLISITVFSYLFIDPNLIYLHGLYSGFAFKYRQETSFLYILLVFLFFAFYFLFLLLLKKRYLKSKDAIRLISISIFILFFSYPAMLSYDIFNYISTSKVLFFYHENPYIIMPIEFIGDPLLSFTHAANKIALYGPFWILLTVIPYFAGFGNFLFTLFSFKLFIVMFYLGTVFLIWKISKNLLSVSLFAFNPLVIIETLVSGHNDIVMIFFALLSFFLLIRKKKIVGFLFLLLSILIKYATIFLIPIFFYIVWKLIKKQKVDWEKVYTVSFLSMFVVFLLSPLREELYSWYAIWFLPFMAFLYKNRFLQNLILGLSFGLILRHIPYMATGNYFGTTPIIRNLLTITPVLIFLIYSWLRKLFQRS